MKWYYSLSYIKLNVLHLGSIPRTFQAFEFKKNFQNSNHILHSIFSACADHIFRQTSFAYKNRTPMLVIVKYSGAIFYIQWGSFECTSEYHLFYTSIVEIWLTSKNIIWYSGYWNKNAKHEFHFHPMTPGSAIIIWLMYLGIFNTNQSESKWG